MKQYKRQIEDTTYYVTNMGIVHIDWTGMIVLSYNHYDHMEIVDDLRDALRMIGWVQ